MALATGACASTLQRAWPSRCFRGAPPHAGLLDPLWSIPLLWWSPPPNHPQALRWIWGVWVEASVGRGAICCRPEHQGQPSLPHAVFMTEINGETFVTSMGWLTTTDCIWDGQERETAWIRENTLGNGEGGRAWEEERLVTNVRKKNWEAVWERDVGWGLCGHYCEKDAERGCVKENKRTGKQCVL